MPIYPRPHGDLYHTDGGNAKTLSYYTSTYSYPNWIYLRIRHITIKEDVDLYINPAWEDDHSVPHYLPEEFIDTKYEHWSYFYNLGRRYFDCHGTAIPLFVDSKDAFGTYSSNVNQITGMRWISGNQVGLSPSRIEDDFSSAPRINLTYDFNNSCIMIKNIDTEYETLYYPSEEHESYDKVLEEGDCRYEYYGLDITYLWEIDYIIDSGNGEVDEGADEDHFKVGGTAIDLEGVWGVAGDEVVNHELPNPLYMENNPTTWYFDDDHKLVLSLMPSILENKLGAFSGCSTLKTVIIPDTCTSIGRWSFYGTSIREVELPENCTYYATSFPEDCVITGGELIT